MNIDGEVIRQLKAGRHVQAYPERNLCQFHHKDIGASGEYPDFSNGGTYCGGKIHHGTGCNEILQAFFGKNSLVGAVDLLKDRKMMFHKVIHFFIRHGTIMHVFADDLRCNIAACAWLWHHDLQRIRRCVADIFLKYFQYIGITAYHGSQHSSRYGKIPERIQLILYRRGFVPWIDLQKAESGNAA